MDIRFMENDNVQMDGVRICYRNFSGTGSKFNNAGDRNFAIVIEDQAVADALIEAGWNVKIKAPREDGDTPFMVLPVKIKFNARGPAVYLKSGGAMNRLDEESINILDEIEIANVDLDIRPYNWEVRGETGRTAYLQAICVTQYISDRFGGSHVGFGGDEE